MTDIKKVESTAMLSINDIWSDPKIKAVIKQSYAADLTNDEFTLFVGLGLSLQANPFKGELFSTVYNKNDQKNRKVSYFCSRDFDRRKAQEQPDYNGHRVDAVYENDDFKSKDGKITHSWKFGDRGKLMGTYGIGWRKGISNPFMVNVLATEYNKGQSTWKTIPETMLKKVVEAQLLRQMYSGILQGVYSIDEKPYIDFTHGLSNPKYDTAPNLSASETEKTDTPGVQNPPSENISPDLMNDKQEKRSSNTIESESIPEMDVDTGEVKEPAKKDKEWLTEKPSKHDLNEFSFAMVDKYGMMDAVNNQVKKVTSGQWELDDYRNIKTRRQMFKIAGESNLPKGWHKKEKGDD